MSSPEVLPTRSGTLKDRLLQAALDGLRDLDPTMLLHAIGAREIARRAGGSPASINHHYGSLSGLAEAVLARVFDTAHLNPPRINELITHVKDSTLPLPVAFAMHEAEFKRLTTDPEFKLRMGLWALGGAQANNHYGPYLRDLDDQLQDAGEALFKSWGRELRPPIDMRLYMALKIALINGTTVRQLADPDDRRMHLFQRATVAIDLVLLRTAGDRQDLDSRLSEMNYYPLGRKGQGTNQRSRETVARILRTANELFNAQGLEVTGIEQIAKNAGTSLTTLKRYYPTKQALAVALFDLQATDEAALNSTATSLHAHLTAITDLARARPALTTAYLTHLTDPNKAHNRDRLLATLTPRLTTNNGANAHDTAEALLLTTLRRALTHRTHAAEDIATHTLSLINHQAEPH